MSLTYQVYRSKIRIQYTRHGRYHRIGGPAFVYQNADVCYYEYGLRHRANGPAVSYPDRNTIATYLRGVQTDDIKYGS